MKHGFRIIDADMHTIEPDDLWSRYLDARFRTRAPAPSRRVRSPDPKSGQRHPHYAVAAAARYDPASHLRAMDIEGIDKAVLFGTRGRHVQMHDDIDPELADALARAHNTWTREFCEADPQRLKFAAQIAYHDVGLAVREVERAVRDLRAVAVIGNPNPVNRRHIQDSHFEPLWSAIEDLGVPVCFHPTGVWTLRDDVGRRFAGHLGGRTIADAARNPLELMLAIASLTIGGVLSRHPKLVCVFLEGGCGWLPWWLERLDKTVVTFPDADTPLTMAPSDYFRRQCYIAADADEAYLPQVVAALGNGNVVMATDYPHRDSLFPSAVDTIIGRADISDEAKKRILWDNALELFPALA